MNGLTAPRSAVQARRLLLYSVKHHGTELIAVPALQSVNSSSLREHPSRSACKLPVSRHHLPLSRRQGAVSLVGDETA